MLVSSFPKLGINSVSPQHLMAVQSLYAQGHIDFCEIMVDNFAHLSADTIKKSLGNMPVALHIVASRFLEKPLSALEALGTTLRPWMAALKPLYVSDHLVQFSANGQRLPVITEYDYEAAYDHIQTRIQRWQTLLDTPLIFENHASITANGMKQAAFFKRLIRETKVDVLFDFSNAYIAEINKISPMAAWDELLANANHYHVAGFHYDEALQLALDTHDCVIADEVLRRMQGRLAANKTLVIEFDAKRDAMFWQQEIARVRNSL